MIANFSYVELGHVDVALVTPNVRKVCEIAMRRRFEREDSFRARYASLEDMLATLVWHRVALRVVEADGRVASERKGFRAHDAQGLWQSIDWAD